MRKPHPSPSNLLPFLPCLFFLLFSPSFSHISLFLLFRNDYWLLGGNVTTFYTLILASISHLACFYSKKKKLIKSKNKLLKLLQQGSKTQIKNAFPLLYCACMLASLPLYSLSCPGSAIYILGKKLVFLFLLSLVHLQKDFSSGLTKLLGYSICETPRHLFSTYLWKKNRDKSP